MVDEKGSLKDDMLVLVSCQVESDHLPSLVSPGQESVVVEEVCLKGVIPNDGRK